MELKFFASFLLFALKITVGLCASGGYEYLLPVGGPKEVIPEHVKQKHLQSAIDFMLSLAGPTAEEVLLAMFQGQVPKIPTMVPGLAADVKGQIVPLGSYDTFEKTVEYFFIMPRAVRYRSAIVTGESWTNLLTSPDPSTAVAADGVKLQVQEAFVDGNMVFLRFAYPIALIYPANRTFAGPIEGEPTFYFAATLYMNRNSEICGYNFQVPHYGALNEYMDGLRDGGFPSPEALVVIPDSPYKRAYLPNDGVTTWLEEICDVATGAMCYPVVGQKYYKDKEDCMEKLGKKPIGGYEDIDRDTLTCRALHRMLVPTRPEGHCKHLAADLAEEDGGVCIDRVSADYNKRIPTFQCGYDDVGYTSAVAVEGAYVSSGYPYTAADFATKERDTVPGPICDVDPGVHMGTYGSDVS